MLTEVERLQEFAAVAVGPVEELGSFWMVMRDPVDNEFCVT